MAAVLNSAQSGEVDSATGNDTNGGWFDTTSAGHDLTYGAFQTVIGFTDIQMDGSSNVTFTSAGNPIQTTWVGNWMRIPGAIPGFTAGLYRIVSVTAGSPNKAVLNTSPAATGATQGAGTIKLGGSLLTIGQAITDATAGAGVNFIWLKYNGGVYAISSGWSSTNSNGVQGYTTTRGDRSTRPTIQHSTTNITTFSMTTFQGNEVYNLIIDGNNQLGSAGISCGEADTKIDGVKLMRLKNGGIIGNYGSQPFGPTIITNCEITGCSSVVPVSGNFGMSFYACSIHDNTSGGCAVNGASFSNCVAYNNTGGSGGFVSNSFGGLMVDCVAYNNHLYGFSASSSYESFVCVNCVAVNNSTFGFGMAAASNNGSLLYNSAGFGNGSGLYENQNTQNTYNPITLTADPFTSAATADFSLNSNAGGGTTLKNAGFPSTYPGTITSTYQDVGMAQHNASGGGAVALGYS